MDVHLIDSFLTPLAATAALLPYTTTPSRIGSAAKNGKIRQNDHLHKPTTNQRSTVTTSPPPSSSDISTPTTIRRPSRAQRRAASLALIDTLQRIAIFLERKHQHEDVGVSPTIGTGVSSSSSTATTTSASTSTHGGDVDNDSLLLVTKASDILLSSHSQNRNTISTLSSLSSSSSSSSLTSHDFFHILDQNILPMRMMTTTTSVSGKAPSFLTSTSTTSSSITSARQKNATSMLPIATWFVHVLADLFMESFTFYGGSNTSAEGGDEDSTTTTTSAMNTLKSPDALGSLFRSLGFFSGGGGERNNSDSNTGNTNSSSKKKKKKNDKLHNLSTNTNSTFEENILLAVIRSIIAKHIRKSITDENSSSNETGFLVPSLQWTAEVLIPWVALLVVGRENMKQFSTLLCHLDDPQKEGKTGQGENIFTNGGIGGAAYLSALRSVGIVPHALSRAPHPAIAVTYTAFPENDDGTGGRGILAAENTDDDDDEEDNGTFSDQEEEDGLDNTHPNDNIGDENTTEYNNRNSNHSRTSSFQKQKQLHYGLRLLKRCDALSYAQVHTCICAARSEQAFDLIRDYPDSFPALFDLRDSIAVCGDIARASLITTLAGSLRTRLLHPGVPTSSILDVFLSTVRCIAIVDAEAGGGGGGASSTSSRGTSILLSLILEPIQSYLRTRQDTIRCIVSSLTEDTDSELYAELVKRDVKRVLDSHHSGGGGDEDTDDEGEIPANSSSNSNAAAQDSGTTTTTTANVWNASSSFVREIIKYKDVNDDNDRQGNASGGTMEDDDATGDADGNDESPHRSRRISSSSSSSLSTLYHLFRVLGPQSRHSLPTNAFARGESMFDDMSFGIYASLGRRIGTSGVMKSGNTDTNNAPTYQQYNDVAALGSVKVQGLWYPAPAAVDAVRGIGSNSGGGKFGDLLSLLVSIYGSKEMFVSEYRSMLSERLLNKSARDFNITNEERTVELLKLRFGDTAMVSAEIMLRDMVDSKRVSVAILDKLSKLESSETKSVSTSSTHPSKIEGYGPGGKEKRSTDMDADEDDIGGEKQQQQSTGTSTPSLQAFVPGETSMDVVVLSGKYWPSLPRDKPMWESHLVDAFQILARGYAEAKKPRELLIVPSLGEVEIELILPTRETAAEKRAYVMAKKKKTTMTKKQEEEGDGEGEEVIMMGEEDDEDDEEDNAAFTTQTFIGTPQQISVLMVLAGRACMPLKELASELKLQTAQVIRLISFWAQKGVLALERGNSGGKTAAAAAAGGGGGGGVGINTRAAHDEDVTVWIVACMPIIETSVKGDSKTGDGNGRRSSTSGGDGRGGGGGTQGSGGGEDEIRGAGSSGGGMTATSARTLEELGDNDDIDGSKAGDGSGGGGDNNSADAEAVAVWQSYVTGMVSNLGGMPLDRIHNTLKMFASMGDYPYEKSQSETTRFLADMCRADKLELADGVYSLKG